MIDHLAYIVFFQLIGLCLIVYFYRIKVPEPMRSAGGYNKQVFILFTVIILSYIYVASVGFPLLNANVNYAKLSFNSNPLAARLIRVVLPCLVFVLAFKFILKKKIFLVTASLMLLTGFKGYVVSYLIVPLLHARVLSGRKIGFKILSLGLFGLASLILFVAYVEQVAILNVFKFIFLRLTIAQYESLIVIVENFDQISKANPILQSFDAALSKFGIGDVKPFNHDLYTYMTGSNPNNIQLATTALVEVYLVFGPVAALVWSLIELIFVMLMLSLFTRYRQNNLALLVLFFSYLCFLDIVFNGNVGLKILDFIVSLSILLTVYIGFGYIYKLLPKRNKK